MTITRLSWILVGLLFSVLSSDVSNVFGMYAKYGDLRVVYDLLCVGPKEEAGDQAVLLGVDYNKVGVDTAGIV